MKGDKIIVFDFDGVFVDDFDFHKDHIEDFLGVKISDKAFYEIHSGNVYEDDKKGLELGSFDVKKYCKKIHNELIQLPIVDGMDKVVLETQKMGKSFIVSSGCEENIKSFFENKNICKNLCTIYGVETHPSKEKKFEKIIAETKADKRNVLFITDTLGDIIEANTIGIASIAVTWGFQRIDTLQKGAPFGFANTSEEVLNLIRQYFEM